MSEAYSAFDCRLGFADFQNRRRAVSGLRHKHLISRQGLDGSVEAQMISSELSLESKHAFEAKGMNGLEQDLFTLNAMAPDLLVCVPALFEESVKESLGYVLGMKETRGVLTWFREAELESRPEVFTRLASRYGDRASPLEKMIDQAFAKRVHDLLERLK